MRLGRIGGAEVRIHPAIFLVVLGAYVLGIMDRLLLGLFALTLHEMSHALLAGGLGYRVSSVELMPFGGVARLAGKAMGLSAELAVAAAGPVCSLVIAAGCALFMRLMPAHSPALREFMAINLSLAALNCMPALPLDGGRMLRAFLARWMRGRLATKITAWLGVVFGAMLMGMSVYYFLQGDALFTMAMMGCFLMLAAIRELRRIPQARLEAMLRRQDTFRWGEGVPLKHIALHARTPVTTAISQLADHRYNLILVIGDDLRAIGELDEGTILAGVAQKGTEATIGELLPGGRGKVVPH